MKFYVVIESEEYETVVVGPYSSEDEAEHAMDFAPLIDDYCDESWDECYVATEADLKKIKGSYATHEVDLSDLYHTGADRQYEAV